jgi:hypothetical protein
MFSYSLVVSFANFSEVEVIVQKKVELLFIIGRVGPIRIANRPDDS